MRTIEKKKISKRFPADPRLDEPTFLNNKKIDGNLYNFLQSISVAQKVNNRWKTVVLKEDLPTYGEICQSVKIKSVNTLKSHLKSLIEYGFVVDCGDYYYELPKREDAYFMIPLETLQFFNDSNTLKVYIYLGQKYSYKENYEFTIEELAKHVGIKLNNNSNAYRTINNILDYLKDLGLIDYITFYKGIIPRKKITNFSLYKSKTAHLETIKK